MEKKQRDRERELSADSLLQAFSHSEYRSFTVTTVSPLTSDSVLVTFSLQPGHTLGLAVGQHILLRCVLTPSIHWCTRQLSRAYMYSGTSV